MNLMISETSLQHAAAATGATHVDVTVDILSYAIGECALGGCCSPVVPTASAPF